MKDQFVSVLSYNKKIMEYILYCTLNKGTQVIRVMYTDQENDRYIVFEETNYKRTTTKVSKNKIELIKKMLKI